MKMESGTGILPVSPTGDRGPQTRTNAFGEPLPPVENKVEQGQDGPATHGQDAHATIEWLLKHLLAAALILVTIAGCKPRSDASRQSGQTPEPSAADVAVVRDALTKGMQQTTFDSLAAADVGKQCVVVTRAGAAGTGGDQAPPPFGMVHRLGQTVIYKGEIEEVLPGSLKIRAPYPTSGRYKTIEVPRSDIQSLHVASVRQ